jgi:peptide/nickel transport system substrate-binding protein
VLRVAPQAEPQSFDPVFAQVNNGCTMVYHQLFCWDAQMNVPSRMVDTWKCQTTGECTRFTLRRGLTFHVGSDVTTRDVMASLRRMFIRDSQDQIVASRIQNTSALMTRSFSIRLKEPFAFTELLLGDSRGGVAVTISSRRWPSAEGERNAALKPEIKANGVQKG